MNGLTSFFYLKEKNMYILRRVSILLIFVSLTKKYIFLANFIENTQIFQLFN